jgi:hypothetical protein
LLGRLIYLFGPFLSTALNRSPLRFCDSKKKNPQNLKRNILPMSAMKIYFQIAECS